MVARRPAKILPKKYLGQNFLKDKNILHKIMAACAFTHEDTVLEIGPGQGVLTEEIAPQVASLYAIEKDKNLYAALAQRFDSRQIHIIHGDILRYDIKKIPGLTKIVGNLPYNISTPIIEKLLHELRGQETYFFTVQWEFGKRMAALKGKKDYSSLSCFVQYHCDVEILFRIKNTSFWPVPKVTSCFIRLTPKKQRICADNERLLFRVIRHAFQQRRKMIINALESIADKNKIKQILVNLQIKPDLRAENLALEEYIRISNEMNQRYGLTAANHQTND